MARVLLLTQPTGGGAFRHVSDLAAGLARRGHEVLLGAPLTALPAGIDAELVPIPMRRALAPTSDLRAVAGLVEALHRTKPNLVHAHSSKAGGLARLARLTAPRLPVIYTPHGYAFAGHFGSAHQRRYRAIERALAPLATRVLCVCEAERRLAASIGPPARTRVVYNGIDPPPLGTFNPPFGHSIVAMARLRPGKGLETLLDAMPAVRADHQAATVTILGDGPDREELARRSERLGVGAAVAFVARRQQWAGILGQAAVFVHPSWAESFPYAILEAMAWARPVVASDVGGIGEAIENGRSGVLVPPRDAASLAGAVNALLADPVGAAALGEEARHRLEARFSVDRMVEGVLDVYREVL